jgi:proteasome beta subunit
MKDPFRGPPLFSPSFIDALRAYAPDLLPTPVTVTGSDGQLPAIAHGTTVAAASYADGVIVGGDRRATEGMSIAQRDIEKVFPADEHSAVAIAGAVGPAIEMVKLFQLELEHYEKIEGFPLSLEGKANRLGQMVRTNLALALQGLVVIPLFCGYDLRREAGRLFRYDVTGGRFEDADYHSTGSGGREARASLKKRWRPGLDREQAIRLLVEAIYDAADEDTATGGPDLVRGIFPLIATVTIKGYDRVGEEELRAVTGSIVAERSRAEHDTGTAGEVPATPSSKAGGKGPTKQQAPGRGEG